MRKNPTRSTRLFEEEGWTSCTFMGSAARRGPNGWVSVRKDGEWQLWRDTHATTAYFASYQTVAAMLKDAHQAFKMPRVRQEIRSQGPKDWPILTKDGQPWTSGWNRPRDEAWAHDDPRWRE